MSSLIENFENAFNTYATAWKEEPVKMAAGHLTAAAAVGAAVYYRNDISQAASKCINDVKSLITSSKIFNNVSEFASKSLATVKDVSNAGIKATVTTLNNAKDVTIAAAKTAKTVALTKLNVAKDAAVAVAKDTATNLGTKKEALLTATSNVLSSASSNAKELGSVVKAKVMSFKI